MPRTRIILLLVFFVLFCLGPMADIVLGQDEHQEFWKVIQAVQDILEGKNTDQARATIAESARLIQGAKHEYLKSVVAGDIKACSLVDTSYHGVAIMARTNPSEDMGLVVLKRVQSDTTKVRYHTVVFLKDSTGQFKIIAWHAGE